MSTSADFLKKYPNLSIWYHNSIATIKRSKSFVVVFSVKELEKQGFDILEQIQNSASELFVYFWETDEAEKLFTGLQGWKKNRKKYIADLEKAHLTKEIYFPNNNTVLSLMDNIDAFKWKSFFTITSVPFVMTNPSAGHVKSAWTFAKKKCVQDDKIAICKINSAEPSVAIVASEAKIVELFNLALQDIEFSDEDIKEVIDENYRVYLKIKIGTGYKKKIGKSYLEYMENLADRLSKALQVDDVGSGWNYSVGSYDDYINLYAKVVKLDTAIQRVRKILIDADVPRNTIFRTMDENPNVEFSIFEDES